ncbi:MAG: hypothetical protein R8K50_11065 [Mariprofundus sp.]
MKRLFTILILLPLFFISGCSTYNASNQSEADQIVSQYHASFKANQWASVLALYEPSFFETHSRDAWKQELNNLFSRYGALTEVRQTFTQKDPRFRGDYYIYGFRLVFDKGIISETITVFKGLETDKLTIAGHILKPVESN